jgi:hypothetical protein
LLSRVATQMSASCLGILLSCYPTEYAVEDGTHDASLKLLGDRFSVQLALQTTEEFLQNVIV